MMQHGVMELCVKLALQQTRVNGLIRGGLWGWPKWKLSERRTLPVIFRTLNVFLITSKEMPKRLRLPS